MSGGSIALIAPSWDQERWVRHFQAVDPNRPVTPWPTIDGGEADYAVVWLPPNGAIASLKGLKVIFNLGAGVDRLLADPTLPDLPLVRGVDPDLTQRMCEYVVLHVLLHLRRQPLYAAQQRDHVWKEHLHPTAQEVTVGIMGLGTLGRTAAGMLLALGFPVTGWSRRQQTVPGVRCFAGADEFDGFLAATEILVSLLPATPATRGIINADLIARLRSDGPLGKPVLINAGRGATQVEADIEAAIGCGALAGASLDVFANEPLDASSPLWDLPGVVITPHAAADSDPEALVGYVMRQIRAFEGKGVDGLEHVVDRDQGY